MRKAKRSATLQVLLSTYEGLIMMYPDLEQDKYYTKKQMENAVFFEEHETEPSWVYVLLPDASTLGGPRTEVTWFVACVVNVDIEHAGGEL